MSERSAPLRSILHAAAHLLRCTTAVLARVHEDRQALVLSAAVSARAAPLLDEVEEVMGFRVSGLEVPLSVTESVLVRALREERLIITQDVTEVAGGALPPEIVRTVGELIGPRTFAVVPVLGRGGALGVLLLEKVGTEGLSAEERDILLVYAERVGAEIESETILHEASRLEQLGSVAPPPPVLWSCAVDGGRLVCPTGPLHTLIGVADPEGLWNPDVQRRLSAGETVCLSVSSLRRVTLTASPDGRVLCAVEDLGWSERLRRELVLAREHLAKVMHSVEDAILTLDGAGVVQQANEATRSVLGLSPAQLCGRSAPELAATPRGREQLQSLQQRLLKTGFAERRLRMRRNQRPFPAHVSALLLGDQNGMPAGAVWRIHDQTGDRRGAAERRRLRLRLLQSERLSAVGEMAARIAHEVRNPLMSIGAAAQVVAEELPADSPVLGEALAIGSEVRRLDGIITDFLRFSRPRRQQAVPTDVPAVLGEVIDLLRKKAGGVHLLLKLPAGEAPLSALIDPDGLRQVMWNLLINACEASLGVGPDAAVECEVRRVGPDRVLIAVADRGRGVPPSVRRRVFDPFFSTKARGTGLGLSICKRIIEEHGGRIRLLNRRGGGTRVVVELRPQSRPALLEAVAT